MFECFRGELCSLLGTIAYSREAEKAFTGMLRVGARRPREKLRVSGFASEGVMGRSRDERRDRWSRSQI